MQKPRLIIGIRRGLYDPEIGMYSLPTCFDSEQLARRALQSMARELESLPDVQLNVVHQQMVSLRPETYGRYDETGEFLRLYEARKDEFPGYVIQIDIPNADELKKRPNESSMNTACRSLTMGLLRKKLLFSSHKLRVNPKGTLLHCLESLRSLLFFEW